MTPRTLRWIVIAVFVVGIAGMIVGSIADDNGVAVTFGLLTAAAAVGLILVTASAPPGAFAKGTAGERATVDGSARGAQPDPLEAERAGQAIEEQVARLVAAGAEEHEVRELVRRAVNFGRQRG